jgi:hypothetical protein
MANKPTKKTTIAKKEFNLDDFKESEGLDNIVKDKELSWIPLSEAFHDALKNVAMDKRKLFLAYNADNCHPTWQLNNFSQPLLVLLAFAGLEIINPTYGSH